jgi:hypothetical protein
MDEEEENELLKAQLFSEDSVDINKNETQILVENIK